MKVFIQKPTESKAKLFVFEYNRFQNGYATIYLGIYYLHFIIYTNNYIGKMKEGIRTHKTIKF